MWNNDLFSWLGLSSTDLSDFTFHPQKSGTSRKRHPLIAPSIAAPLIEKRSSDSPDRNGILINVCHLPIHAHALEDIHMKSALIKITPMIPPRNRTMRRDQATRNQCLSVLTPKSTKRHSPSRPWMFPSTVPGDACGHPKFRRLAKRFTYDGGEARPLLLQEQELQSWMVPGRRSGRDCRKQSPIRRNPLGC